ncbi:MAG: hypothetical protein A2W09_02735 [Deltaproteobacteria bacterium RBG_16_50_11]|nr:MAG: hypothetical protein A2W09_02735 [Deltaproteobacteria bacterium RBG_16_50_11]
MRFYHKGIEFVTTPPQNKILLSDAGDRDSKEPDGVMEYWSTGILTKIEEFRDDLLDQRLNNR